MNKAKNKAVEIYNTYSDLFERFDFGGSGDSDTFCIMDEDRHIKNAAMVNVQTILNVLKDLKLFGSEQYMFYMDVREEINKL